MENKYEKWAMESLDEITDKLKTGVLFDGENEKLIKKILFEEQARMYNKSKNVYVPIAIMKVLLNHIPHLEKCLWL